MRNESDEIERVVRIFMAKWLAGNLGIPVCCCATADLYRAYVRWCDDGAADWPLYINGFVLEIRKIPGINQVRKAIRHESGAFKVTSVVMLACDKPDRSRYLADWLADRLAKFAAAMDRMQ